MSIRLDRTAQQLTIPTRHQVVGDTHHFAEHFPGRFTHPDGIAEALAHLLRAIKSLEDGKHHGHLGLLSLLFLQIAPDHDVEKLVGAAQFNVGLDHHRIPSLHDRVLQFMGADGQ